jgi:hypothetical protein
MISSRLYWFFVLIFSLGERRIPALLGWLGDFVDVQGEAGHRKAAKKNEEILGGECHDSIACEAMLSDFFEL